MATVYELRQRADSRLLAGDFLSALRDYALLVQVQPSDLDARLRVGDSLLALGEVQRAAVVYTTLARHAAHAGYPLRALVALKLLSTLEPQLGVLLRGVADLYAVGSPRLGRGVRLSPGDPDYPLPGPLPQTPITDPRSLIETAERIASSTDSVAMYPPKLPPLPLFSELPADAFEAVMNAVKLVRTRPGETLVRQGEQGRSFYVIARGSVRVSRTDERGGEVLLASLQDGAIFGEMALVSATARTATVAAITDTDLLEFDSAALAAASRQMSTIARALETFTRERLLNNLLATAPLFKSLDRTQRMDLLRRFTAHDVPAGAEIVQEGAQGQGLYLLLSGEVAVWKTHGSDRVRLATLKPGQVFGEISLLNDEPTTATVVAVTQSTVLFLARDYFRRLMIAVADVRAYVETLGEERLMDTRISLSGDRVTELTDEDLMI